MFEELTETYQMRTDIHKEEKALTLRIKAIMRRMCEGDTKAADKLYEAVVKDKPHDFKGPALIYTEPLFQSRKVLEDRRLELEKYMAKFAKDLPAYDFMKEIKGFGDKGLSMIAASAGDLTKYPTPAKLWKYMGLAVMPDGRQRKVAGDKELAELHAYAPHRRALVWTIGDSLLRTNDGFYKQLYLDRKERELEKAEEEGLIVIPAKEAENQKLDKSTYRSKGHIHSRAKRYVEKRLLRDLWAAWREEVNALPKVS